MVPVDVDVAGTGVSVCVTSGARGAAVVWPVAQLRGTWTIQGKSTVKMFLVSLQHCHRQD